MRDIRVRLRWRLSCDPADFDGNGDVGTDQHIDAFFRVLAGGSC